ncbi:hypothetical protein QE152_g39850 [Popillia japonica]|uniref:Uncharacterized protein n=1 Tax=Popillia japonica TaxID=7064 RepID=A0AAW1HTJ2_POPJA
MYPNFRGASKKNCGHFCEKHRTTSGVPQETTLGPLFFVPPVPDPPVLQYMVPSAKVLIQSGFLWFAKKPPVPDPPVLQYMVPSAKVLIQSGFLWFAKKYQVYCLEGLPKTHFWALT